MTKQKIQNVLEKYRSEYVSFNVALQIFLGKDAKPDWRHFTYPSEEYTKFFEFMDDECSDRIVFPNEIVVDSDLKIDGHLATLKTQYEIYTRFIYAKMFKHKISHSVWFSGNKSYHIHSFFDNIPKDLSKDDLRMLKELFIRWLFNCDRMYPLCRKCEGLYSNGVLCQLRVNSIDLELCHSHMIRIEYGYNYKSGKRKMLVRESKFKVANLIPEEVMSKFYYIKSKRISYVIKNVKLKPVDKPCLNFLLNNKLYDCKKRASFILVNNLLKQYSKEEVKVIMKGWNTIQDNPFNDAFFDSMIAYHYKNKQTPGCRYAHDLLSQLGQHKIIERCENNELGSSKGH